MTGLVAERYAESSWATHGFRRGNLPWAILGSMRRPWRPIVALVVTAAACTRASGVSPTEAVAQSPPGVGTVGCSARGALPAPGTLILFRRDGCVPPSDLFGFRCSQDEPPVLELRSGDVAERFVGGPFAVPVDRLPSGAFPIGEGAGVEVYRVPDEPSMVYVGQGDGVTRWLRLPRRRIGSPPVAFVLGDSIADGAAPFITESLPGWTVGIDALVGRGTASAIADAAAQGALRPDVVVVELGTNDADPKAFRRNAVTILDSLRRVPLVVWQTALGPLDNIPGVNVRIRGTVPLYPNTLIADWEAFVDDGRLSSDGVHPAPGQEDLMARLIAPMLLRWLDAASGAGATSCADQAERAVGVGPVQT